MQIDRMTTCCFTGHRPRKLPSPRWQPDAYAALRARLRRKIHEAYDKGYEIFLCGMALGADTWFAEEVLRMQAEGPTVALVAAIPCPEQADRWSTEQQLHYRDLLDQAAAVHCCCPQYEPYCMQMRNQWMVENSSRIIAVYDGSAGGTGSTLRLAQQRGLERDVISINSGNDW